MSVLTTLLILILSAKLLGRLFRSMNQPSIIGEMLAGVILGPSVLNLFHATPDLAGISELAVFLVILQAGLEMDIKDIIGSLKGRGAIVALIGFLIPFLCGIGMGIVFHFDEMRTIFLALCISITALPVAVRILESFKILDGPIAKVAISTAIVNDLIALLILGAILNIPDQTNYWETSVAIGTSVGKLLLLLVVVWLTNFSIRKMQDNGVFLQQIPEKIISRFGEEALFSVVIGFVLVFGSLSDVLGFHFIIGAFFGALLINKDFFFAVRRKELERTIGSISSGFLTPMFFAYIGLEFSISEMDSTLFVVVLLAVSILSKLAAGYVGGRYLGFSKKHSWGLGAVLNGRGVMEIVVASIALQKGFIGQGLFSALVLMGVITTMLTPFIFRKAMKGELPENV
jgi:Kef-type K+ transport system membrane component KefB